MLQDIQKMSKRLFGKVVTGSKDPIDAQIDMINGIQKLAGVHNVFGDSNRRYSLFDFAAIVVFGGPFLYVGLFSQLIYLVQVFPDKVETFKVINCLSGISVPFSKYIFMWMARSRLRTIIEMSRSGLSSIPDGTPAQTIMMSTLKKARLVSWFVVISQGVAHVGYLMLPFFFTVFGNQRYLPTTPGDAYGLTPAYSTPFYEITFTLTSLGILFSGINQAGYIVLFVTLLAHDLGHFYSITETCNELYQILNSKSKSDVTKTVDEKLKFCIKHHQFLLQYHDKIKELYQTVFGAHFVMMTIVLVTTLQTLNEWDIRNTILTAITGIMPLFIYCFGGELLISSGDEMSFAIYSCGWEQMKTKHAKVVLLMFCISQRTLCLTAMDFFVMNRETFGNVAQVVYKVYAVFD